MKSLIDYVKRNKHWLFSGIGIVILGLIWSLGNWIWSGNTHKPSTEIISSDNKSKNLNNQKPKAETIISDNNEKHLSTSTSPTHNIIESITPERIKEIIDKAPILQRNDIIKHYIGIKVKWEGELVGANKIDDNLIGISIKPKHLMVLIRFEINPKNYPGLSLLREGHILKVEGKIKDIEVLYFNLSEAKIILY